MGQGYSLTTLSAGSAGIDVPELSDLVYEKSMGGGRFMKSIRARQQNGLVFVKVIMKPYPSMKMDPYIQAIIRPYHRWSCCLKLPNTQKQGNASRLPMSQMLWGISGFWKPVPVATLSVSISTALFTTG